MENPEKLIDVFLIVFIGMGPIKALLIYIGITQGADAALQRQVARKSVMTATSIGLLLLLAGVVFMRLLHFTPSALTVAGGLILLALALNMVLGQPKKDTHGAPPDAATMLSQAVYPLGIPLLLNPVGIVALTVLSAETTDPVQIAAIAIMVLIVAAIDYVVFVQSHRLDKLLSHERILVLEKLLGIMLAALAVQMMLNGLAELGVFTMSGGVH